MDKTICATLSTQFVTTIESISFNPRKDISIEMWYLEAL